MNAAGLAQARPDAGAVLPIALFGVLVISLLVSSALITASSELVLSRAYQDGLRSLHSADAAVESFVSSGGLTRAGREGDMRGSAAAPGGESFDITLTLLRNGEVEVDSAGIFSRRDLFSIVAEPTDGRGRVAGALLEAVRQSPPFRSAVDAAATVAGDVTVGAEMMLTAPPQGEAFCPQAAGSSGLRISANSTLGGAGVPRISGATARDTAAGGALIERTLAGASFASLSGGAAHYFGQEFGRAPFQSLYGPRRDAARPDYRWGCPEGLAIACPRETAVETPVTVLDAAGGEVDLDGGHGQGVLLVLNGSARLRGDFAFAGLVLVEGDLRMEGTAQIVGGAVVGGDLALGASGLQPASPAIVLDGCRIAAAERALSIARLNAAPQTLDSPTFGWYEVVR